MTMFDERVEAAAEGMWDRYGDRGMFTHAPEHMREAFKTDARAALLAADAVVTELDPYDDFCPTCDAPNPWHTETCAVPLRGGAK